MQPQVLPLPLLLLHLPLQRLWCRHRHHRLVFCRVFCGTSLTTSSNSNRLEVVLQSQHRPPHLLLRLHSLLPLEVEGVGPR
jgi:hypothetical protein